MGHMNITEKEHNMIVDFIRSDFFREMLYANPEHTIDAYDQICNYEDYIFSVNDMDTVLEKELDGKAEIAKWIARGRICPNSEYFYFRNEEKAIYADDYSAMKMAVAHLYDYGKDFPDELYYIIKSEFPIAVDVGDTLDIISYNDDTLKLLSVDELVDAYQQIGNPLNITLIDKMENFERHFNEKFKEATATEIVHIMAMKDFRLDAKYFWIEDGHYYADDEILSGDLFSELKKFSKVNPVLVFQIVNQIVQTKKSNEVTEYMKSIEETFDYYEIADAICYACDVAGDDNIKIHYHKMENLREFAETVGIGPFFEWLEVPNHDRTAFHSEDRYFWYDKSSDMLLSDEWIGRVEKIADVYKDAGVVFWNAFKEFLKNRLEEVPR